MCIYFVSLPHGCYCLRQQISVTVPTQRKEVDDVLGGDAAWANVDKTRGAFMLKCARRCYFLI